MNTYDPTGMNQNNQMPQQPMQQGNPYAQQGNPYMQQGNPYAQQGNPYMQQGNPYMQQTNPYMQQPGGGYNRNYGAKEKAPNVFKQFAYSFVPPKYNELAKVRTGGMIGFVTLLALVFSLISFVDFSYVMFSNDGITDLIEQAPDFALEDGEFWIEEEVFYEEDGMYVYITDEVDEFTYDDVKDLRDEGYTDIMLISEENLCLYQDYEYQELPFEDIKGMDFDREWLAETLMPMIWLFVAIGYVFFFVGRIFWYFLCAAIYMLIGMLIALCFNKQISAGNLFRAAVYSKVFMCVIASLWALFPIGIGIPWLLRVIATCVFMGFAIQYLPKKW